MTALTGDLLSNLAAGAEAADSCLDWPPGWDRLRHVGVTRWSIPAEFGGDARPPAEILAGCEAIAGACLTTAFILSQREAAARRLLAGPAQLQKRFLPPAARGDEFLTIGVSQITTSRQHVAPVLRATPAGAAGFRLDGQIPWVTGADRAAAVVVRHAAGQHAVASLYCPCPSRA